MRLIEHIKSAGGTATLTCDVLRGIADRAGCNHGTLHQIALGHKKPSWRLSLKIERATHGAVTRHDLRSDVFGPAPERAA